MKLCLQFCWKIENQESSANTVELEHITEEFNKKSNSLYTKVASLEAGPETFKYLTHYHEHTKREHDLLGDQSDEDVEGVENAKWTTIKAVLLLLLGTVIAASFADPLVDAVDNFSSATSIPSFFISFIALPLANNSSEAVSAIIFASRKRLRSASLTFSETLIMGNRDAIDEMSGTNAAVLLSILKLIEKYDLYGQVAYPKRHEQSEVPDIYRLAAKTKAIEVVDLDQQTKMVAELDGHVMRCVRDQNGNHVIQKCIECIPEDAIQFIVSTFYDQVVTLSTHPYGCRVIQRVLEHCSDPKTQQIVMDEILRSVFMLAQDQYGNYVVQHVLEHGKPHERTCIINQLIGQIVQMSQQKFASNVVEKCLTFGTPEERQGLVNEMLGTTDENEPLQAMMKDQFANYVVQKVLETCDDQQLELILNRIKVHLNALKKYTYGKHIVARVEKLVAAGERRIGILASYSAAAASVAAVPTSI